MATRFYIGVGSDWNTDANWATTSGGAGPASFPTIADDAIFDSNSGNCTLDANAACLSLTIGTSGSLYTGTFDSATFDVTIGTGGFDCTFAGSATIDMGSGTWTCSGDFDYVGTGTFDSATSTLVMDTNGTSIFASIAEPLHLLQTSANVALLSIAVDGITVTSGTLTVTNTVRFANTPRNLTVQSGGTIAGVGKIEAFFDIPIDIQSGGTFSMTGAHALSRTVDFVTAASFTGTWSFSVSDTVTFPSGTTTFTGNVEFRSGNASGRTVDLVTNNGSLVFQGDFTITEDVGLVTWSKGTGGISFSGTNDQTLTFPASFPDVLDDVTVDKSAGRVTLAEDFVTDSFTFDDGDLDLDGFTIDSQGAVDINGNTGARFHNGTDFSMANGGGTHGQFLVGQGGSGNLTLDGNGGQLEINDLDFDYDNTSTGNALSCDVEDSLGPAGLLGSGADIDATDASNNEIGGINTGWDFAAVPAVGKFLTLLGVGR